MTHPLVKWRTYINENRINLGNACLLVPNDEYDVMESDLAEVLAGREELLWTNTEIPSPNFLYKGVWVVRRR